MDGDLIGAAEDFERARTAIRSLGGQSSDDVLVTMRLADLRLRAGDVDGARRHLEAMRAQPSFGASQVLHDVLAAATEGAIAVAAKDDGAVASAYTAMQAALATLGVPSMMNAHSGAIGHAAAAALALRLGRRVEAGEHLREGYAQALLTNDKPILAAVAMSVALLARALGRPRDAAVLFGAAVRLRGAEDPTNPSVAELLGSLRETLGDGFDVAYAEGLALDPDEAAARIDPEAVQ